jgi:hypothetical protein
MILASGDECFCEWQTTYHEGKAFVFGTHTEYDQACNNVRTGGQGRKQRNKPQKFCNTTINLAELDPWNLCSATQQLT